MTAPVPPILPDLSVVGAGKDALVAERPDAAPWVESGVWSHLFVGWRAQYAVARQGLADEASAARLALGSGQALTELARGTYDTERGEARRAIGEVFLSRKVVHVRPDAGGASMPTADALSFAGIQALVAAFYPAMTGHLVSVYSPSTGLGSHLVADDPADLTAPGSPSTAGDYVALLNSWKLQWNRHVANQAVGVGAILAVHGDPDTDRTIAVDNAFASSPSSAFSAQSLASQQSILLVSNALRRATIAHFALETRAGTIRAGTRFAIVADPVAVPAVLPSEHATTVDVFVAPGTKIVSAPTVAFATGADANLPLFPSRVVPTVQARDALFDASAPFRFAPALLRAAGGTSGQSDPLLRTAASVSWRGSRGPTNDGLRAGVLRSAGAARFVEISDPVTGTAFVYAVDESWSQSDAWLAELAASLRSGEWSGVGQRVRFGQVLNATIRVRLTVFLRDSAFLNATDAIATKIKTALVRYFDDRPDWHVFRTATVGDAAAAADRRTILSVSSPVVTDQNGVPIADPSPPPAGSPAFHWRLDDNALDATFLPPG